MSELSRIGVAIEADLLEEFDRLIENRGYPSRSEAFRDMIRAEIGRDEVEADDETVVVGTVTLVFSGIRNGLLAQPDMHISGSGDIYSGYRWFQDQTDGVFG